MGLCAIYITLMRQSIKYTLDRVVPHKFPSSVNIFCMGTGHGHGHGHGLIDTLPNLAIVCLCACAGMGMGSMPALRLAMRPPDGLDIPM